MRASSIAVMLGKAGMPHWVDFTDKGSKMFIICRNHPTAEEANTENCKKAVNSAPFI